MKEEKKYKIFAQAPHQVGLEEFGLPADGRERFRTILEGNVSMAEYAAIYGDDHRITESMCVESYDRDGYTIRIFLEDVIAIENPGRSHHAWMINSMLAQQNRPELTPEEIEKFSRDYDNISPEAAEFLMYLADQDPKGPNVDYDEAIRKAYEQSLTLNDFIQEEKLNRKTETAETR